MKKKDILMKRGQVRKLIRSGRSAIKYCMASTLLKPGVLPQRELARIEQLSALLITYDELMSAFEKPQKSAKTADQITGGAK